MTIEFIEKPFSREESLLCLKDYVRVWFTASFAKFTPPQEYSFKLISEGKNVIITAPTGSGKTLTGFLAILSELFKLGEEGKLEESIYCIYISPLKALDNDVQKNLLVPLKEIREIARSAGKELPEVRAALRTLSAQLSICIKEHANGCMLRKTTNKGGNTMEETYVGEKVA